jgi:predicted transcriptional regulator
VTAVYRYQIITQVDEELHQALQFAAANIRPKKTKSEICREAIFAYLNWQIPDAFKKPDAIAAE